MALDATLVNLDAFQEGGNAAGRAVGRSIGLTAASFALPFLAPVVGGLNDMTKTTADYTKEVAGVYGEMEGFTGWVNTAQDQAAFLKFYNEQRQDVGAYNKDVIQFNAEQRQADLESAAYKNDMAVATRMAQQQIADMAAYQQGQQELRLRDIENLKEERAQQLANLREARAEQGRRQVMKLLRPTSEYAPSVPVAPQMPLEPEFDVNVPLVFQEEDRSTAYKILMLLAAVALIFV